MELYITQLLKYVKRTGKCRLRVCGRIIVIVAVSNFENPTEVSGNLQSKPQTPTYTLC
jgi:hypothetical protein